MRIGLEIKRVRRSLADGLKAAVASWNVNRDRYRTENSIEPLTEEVLHAVGQIRGLNRPPAIFVHGVMTRSGTNHCGELIRQHSDITAYPHNLWEVPLLQANKEVESLHHGFLTGYRKNRTRIGAEVFKALVGAAFVGYLYAGVPESKRLLVKVPAVSYLDYFSTMFPMEDCLLLMRDGRDVVASSLKTWPGKDFSDTVKIWREATLLMNNVLGKPFGDRTLQMYKFEDISSYPEIFVNNVCEAYGLDRDRYPFENIAALPVKGSSNLSLAGEVDWKPQEKPKGFVNTGKWENWTWREKAIFKRIAGDVLIQSGYVEDHNW